MWSGCRVGDEKLDWALQQLVDLPYLWLTATDNRTIGQLPAGPLVLPNISRVIPDNASASGQPGSVQYYATLLNNTLKVHAEFQPLTELTSGLGFIGVAQKYHKSRQACLLPSVIATSLAADFGLVWYALAASARQGLVRTILAGEANSL